MPLDIHRAHRSGRTTDVPVGPHSLASIVLDSDDVKGNQPDD
jgi:hypothetical protein